MASNRGRKLQAREDARVRTKAEQVFLVIREMWNEEQPPADPYHPLWQTARELGIALGFQKGEPRGL